MRDFITILEGIAEIKHWRSSPRTSARGDELALPPMIFWTWKQRSSQLADLFQEAITSFQGTIGWDFSERASWCLMPSRLREYALQHNLPGEWEAATILKTTDPDFGMRANAELLQLGEHIERYIGART